MKCMKLVKLDINKHDTHLVAGLIYETDVSIFNFYFKNKQNASDRIKKLVEKGNSNYGYENIYVVTGEDDQVYGLLLISHEAEEDIKNDFKVYGKTLNLWDALKFVFLDIVDGMFLSDLEEDDFYLAAIAVDINCRGKGIGTSILEKSLNLAREKGCKRVVLDVDLDNKGALKLYERVGFEIFKKKSIKWFTGEKGVYNMEYVLNGEKELP